MLAFRKCLSLKLHIRKVKTLKYPEKKLEVKKTSQKLFKKYLPREN